VAHDPHAGRLQLVASGQSFPGEVTCTTEDRRHFNGGTVLVPESAASYLGAVGTVLIVVTVVGGKHHPVVVAEAVPTGVTRVTGHVKRVAGLLCLNDERTVLGVVPAASGARLQVESELVAAVERQLTEQFVAEPVVASRVIEADFELRPGPVEEVGTVEVLLDQQRNASL